MSAEELVSQALELPEKERAYIAEKLLASIDDDDFPVSEEWRAEIDRRVREIDEGKADWVALPKAIEDLRAELQRIDENR